MKVLLIEPMKHPRVVEIGDTMKEVYRILDCQTIAAAHPWDDTVGLVIDNEGMYSGKPPNRYIEELEQPIMGNFFLCGLNEDEFFELPDTLVKKYTEHFWRPEIILGRAKGFAVITLDDGTKPE